LALEDLALAPVQSGRLEDARACHERAIAVFVEIGNRGPEATARGNLARLAHEQGRFEEAARAYEEAMRLIAVLGNGALESVTRRHLGSLRHAEGRVGDAVAEYEHALPAIEEGGDPQFLGDVLSLHAAALADLGRTDEARDAFARAEKILGSTAATLSLSVLELLHAHLDRALGRHGEVACRVREALPLAPSSREIRLALHTLNRAGAAPREDGASCLFVGEGVRWFKLGDGARVDLARRRMLKLLFQALVEAAAARPGAALSTQALLAAAWPGERVSQRWGRTASAWRSRRSGASAFGSRSSGVRTAGSSILP
jgi:hypothetical protein